MQKHFLIFMMCAWMQLEASDALVIPKKLGKPPLAPKVLTVQERIDRDFENYSNLYPEKNNTQIFEILLENATQALHQEEDWLLQKELQKYKDLIWQKIEQLESLQLKKYEASVKKQQKKQQKNINKARMLLERERVGKSLQDFKKRVEELIKSTSDEILVYPISLEELERLLTYRNVFNETLETLK